MVRLSLENHAQDPDFRAGIAGGDLICSHGFGKRVPQGGRSGGPGCIVPYDLITALSFLQKAAEFQHAGALFTIGVMLYQGNELAKDYVSAFEYFLLFFSL